MTAVVHTGSRLHFGLFSLPCAGGASAAGSRQFGGVGLMIKEPGVQVRVQAAREWSAEGPLADRALDFAQRFSRYINEQPNRRFHIAVKHCAPEHAGLGTGTQLGLAVARAIALETDRSKMTAVELGWHIGRGQRSGIGIHGFAEGGLLVDGGKGLETTVAPLIARLAFPEDWHIVLINLGQTKGLHGMSETAAFAQFGGGGENTDALCRLTLRGILPAAAERDLPGFGAALHEFNRRVGEMFRPLQGGIYAHPQSEALAEFIRRENVAGVGQSSWGPTMFAIAERDRAGWIADKIRARFGCQPGAVNVTCAANEGAVGQIVS